MAGSPRLHWQATGPTSTDFNDVYFSADDGVAESRYVFLSGIELSKQIAGLSAGGYLTLAETGFGTGLNFLLTLQTWLNTRAKSDTPTEIHLHYIGIDAFPLRRSDLQRAASLHPELTDLSSALIADWPQPSVGCHRIRWPHWNVVLDLWWELAEDALVDLASHGNRWIDAWYLDGFAPSRNQSMWHENLYRSIAALSRPGAVFATFSAAGDVRRGLMQAGFTVHKRPGFGRKRECLAGVLTEPRHLAPSVTPWDIPAVATKPSSALVIGAGLAGSFVARSLAERGIAVTVLDRDQIAGGGSSNLQGLTYTRLSHRFAPLSDFSLAAYDFATRHYQQALRSRALTDGTDGGGGGYLQLGTEPSVLDALAATLSDPEGPARVLNATQASQTSGVEVGHAAIYFPDALWLNPPAVCRERLAHPFIRVIDRCGDVSIAPGNRGWTARWGDKQHATADIAILATAGELKHFPQTAWLPLQAIRGQVSHVAANEKSRQMRTSICHEGYLPMARDQLHCLGATYGPNDERLDERAQDHHHNLSTVAKWLPTLGLDSLSAKVSGHVALRCTSADYLPVAGAVTDPTAFNRLYAELAHKKTTLIHSNCPVVDGLWMVGGLGSRGLTTAPLIAEILAGQICAEPPVLPRYLNQSISPARFLKRALVRGEPIPPDRQSRATRRQVTSDD